MISDSSRVGIIGAVILALAVCGCTQSVGPAATDAANASADRILSAIGSGSYADYSKNFSDTMIARVNESQFNDTRSAVQDLFGNYVSRTGPRTSVIQGYDVFVYDCTFTRGHANFQLTMNVTDPYRVEGIFLRKP